MVAGFHLIWTAYGWWLPNDPRGSSSHEIRVEPIADLGDLYPGRKPIQPPGREIKEFYTQAREVLKHPLLTFDDGDITAIAESFGQVIQEQHYTCYACAIMPDHVHVLIRKHRDRAETMIENLQQASRSRLIGDARRAVTHPVWGGLGWKVFLSTPQDFIRVIDYIWKNPIKIGRPLSAGVSSWTTMDGCRAISGLDLSFRARFIERGTMNRSQEVPNCRALVADVLQGRFEL